jgi:hypothetical protein
MKFCPRCGSANITFLVYYQPSQWQYLACSYQGAFVVEDSQLAEEIRAKRQHADAEQ